MKILNQVNNYVDESIEQSDTIYAIVLGAGEVQTITIPSNAKYVLFSARVSFASELSDDATAAIFPVADDLTGNASELNPTGRYTADATHVSIASLEANAVTLAFYK